MAVGADEGVGVGEDRAVGRGDPHHLAQVFEVHLVADAGPGRDDAEVVEGLLTPTKELVAFEIALVLPACVVFQGLRSSRAVDHEGMVDDQVERHEGIDPAGVGLGGNDGVAHRGKVDDRGHTGEVLHQHACRPVRDLPIGGPVVEPRRDRLDVVDGDTAAVLKAQQVLEQDLQGRRQPRNVAQSGLGNRLQAEVVVGVASDGELPAGAQRVVA